MQTAALFFWEKGQKGAKFHQHGRGVHCTSARKNLHNARNGRPMVAPTNMIEYVLIAHPVEFPKINIDKKLQKCYNEGAT